MNLLGLAARNLGCNPRRTAVTLGAAAFAAVTMIVYAALMEGMGVQLERNALAPNPR